MINLNSSRGQGGQKKYSSVLKISVWAKLPLSSETEGIALPIDKDPKKILCGAPQACECVKYQVVNDTKCEEHWDVVLKEQPQKIKDDIKNYFKDQAFSSFFSHRLERQKKRLGVVNIESKDTFVMGKTDYASQEICKCLEPLFALLALLVEEEYNLTNGGIS